MALVAGEMDEGVGGGIGVEGVGEGLAGEVGALGIGLEFVELALGVLDALEFPEEGGGLGEEGFLEAGGGVEVLADFLFEDLVGGATFVGEKGGLGAEAVFEGVLGGFGFAGGGAGAGGFFGVFAVRGEAFW